MQQYNSTVAQSEKKATAQIALSVQKRGPPMPASYTAKKLVLQMAKRKAGIRTNEDTCCNLLGAFLDIHAVQGEDSRFDNWLG